MGTNQRRIWHDLFNAICSTMSICAIEIQIYFVPLFDSNRISWKLEIDTGLARLFLSTRFESVESHVWNRQGRCCVCARLNIYINSRHLFNWRTLLIAPCLELCFKYRFFIRKATFDAPNLNLNTFHAAVDNDNKTRSCSAIVAVHTYSFCLSFLSYCRL
jgi:hypothetical protein